MEERLGFPQRMRYVEKLGSKVSELLTTKNPWEGKCGRVTCFPCRSKGDEGGRCTQQNVTYRIECIKCKENGIKAHYIGESARTAFYRGEDHLEDLKKHNQKNALVKHLAENHPGEHWDIFEMKGFSKYNR